LLRRVAPAAVVNEIWTKSADRRKKSVLRCPSCDKAMVDVALPQASGTGSIAVCRSCHFFWLTESAFERLPKTARAAEPRGEALSAESRREIALARSQLLAEQVRAFDESDPGPDAAWHWLPGALGVPVPLESSRLGEIPWVTLLLALAIGAIGILELFDAEAVVHSFGLVPAHWERLGGLTLLTSFFVHAGWEHLLGNAGFLVLYGLNVEGYTGSLRYAGLVAAATVAGGVAHILTDLGSTVPVIGASGGISGIVTFYALRFPRARLAVLTRVRWIRLPAWSLLVIWIAYQVYLFLEQIEGRTDVSAAAHLGGAFVGFVAWLLSRER